jgi:NTE family protein
MLSRLVGPFHVKEYFHWVAQARHLREDLQEDWSFVRAMRSALLPVPVLDREPILEADLFAQWRPLTVEALRGKKVGIVATGGSGAMICALGAMRACQEAELDIAAISTCSGSALFLAPVAAGLSVQETLDFVFSWRRQDYVDPEWGQLLKIPLALGRGFTGLLNSAVVEELYHERLGGLLLKDMAIPFYANIWDVDHNRVLYLGTRSAPDLRLARLVRAAITLPIFIQPVEIDGVLCGDGGAVNVFPVEPLVRHHPEIDYYIGVNAFYPENFDGEDFTGWHHHSFSPLRVSPQARHSQHLESARMQLRLIEDRCLLLHPVPYTEIKGVKFYEQFVDRQRWPEFVLRGYHHARRNLALLDRSMATANEG